MKHKDTRPPTSPVNASGSELVELVQRHAPSCAYSARKLAVALAISERQLQRIFAAALRQSPQDWLNRQRLDLARQMLPSARSVKEVAHALGFRRASHFSRDFRQTFGEVPSRFLPACPVMSVEPCRAPATEQCSAQG